MSTVASLATTRAGVYFFVRSLAVRAKVISLTCARNMVALGKLAYRHDQRKISEYRAE
jgi:hypothetical protein